MSLHDSDANVRAVALDQRTSALLDPPTQTQPALDSETAIFYSHLFGMSMCKRPRGKKKSSTTPSKCVLPCYRAGNWVNRMSDDLGT